MACGPEQKKGPLPEKRSLFCNMSFSAPHGGHHQHEQRHDLQPSEQHRQREDELAEIGEEAEVAGGAERAETGADVADGRE